LRALCLLRQDLHYRRESYCVGLKRRGYSLVDRLDRPQKDDVLLIWNRYGAFHEEANRFEAAGATVLVTENGWLGKTWRDGEWFTLCRSHHAGAGHWHDGGPSRWDSWGVTLEPWRNGGELVVFGQRGIGEPGIKAPSGWAEHVSRKLGGRVRQHPGVRETIPLEDDLAKCGRVATWNSGAALKALILGIPVMYDFPKWIGGMASSRLGEPLKTDDESRLAMFRRLAWSMWTLDEIRSGEAWA
jgi:hypothetical protein